ncbi:unnamed protein product [Symbiodinium sp. CCMP2592]|nr:unnamed protein product [Symbiodinium sp. CCMP2592]
MKLERRLAERIQALEIALDDETANQKELEKRQKKRHARQERLKKELEPCEWIRFSMDWNEKSKDLIQKKASEIGFTFNGCIVDGEDGNCNSYFVELMRRRIDRLSPS